MSSKKTAQTNRRWITTKATQQWNGKKYVLVAQEGYWYEGPVALAHEAAFTEEQAWRVYDDTDTPLAAQDTDPVSIDVDTPFQMCFRIANTSVDTGEGNSSYDIQYNHAGNGWTDTGVSDGGGVKVANATAGLVNNSTYGTDRLTGATLTRLNGWEQTVGSKSSVGLDAENYMEIVYGLQIDGALVANNDNIEFKIVRAGTIELDGNVNASVTAVDSGQTVAYNQALETDVAQTITPVPQQLTRAYNQAVETDVAQTITATPISAEPPPPAWTPPAPITCFRSRTY